MDITEHPRLGAQAEKSIKLQKAIAYPEKPVHQEDIEPLITKLSKSNMHKNLEKFTAFHTRYYKSKWGVESAAWLKSRIEDMIREAGAEKNGVNVREFPHAWGQPSLIATIPGRTNHTVIIGAHQDSINLFLPSVLSAPGADDDGSGTVTILEAFRVFLSSSNITGSANQQPLNTVEFHWYSAEEGGLLGSQAIFSSYEMEGREVKAMLQQDMTGYIHKTVAAGEPESVGVITDFVDKGLTEFIKEVITTVSQILPSLQLRIRIVCHHRSHSHSSIVPSRIPSQNAVMRVPITPRPPRPVIPQPSSSSQTSSTRMTTSTPRTMSLTIWTLATCCSMHD